MLRYNNGIIYDEIYMLGIGFMVFKATFKKYFSYIVAVNVIDGGNQSTWRKPPTCRKSLPNFNT